MLNKRGDGYHNIFSFNASIDLFDVLIFEKIDVFEDPERDNLIKIIPAGGEYADIIRSVDVQENLISKAITAYFNKIRKSGDISVSVKKNIPAGAGLGGGSSNAAATLVLLNNYLKALEEKELYELGSKIGADVPYCMTGGLAICKDLGERIEKVEGKLNHSLLLVNSGIHVDTARAYNSLNRQLHISLETQERIEESREPIRDAAKKGSISHLAPSLKNDFERPVFEKYPELRALKDEITNFGADYVTMTGSGSSIIGLFSDIDKAEKAEKSLSKKAKTNIAQFI